MYNNNNNKQINLFNNTYNEIDLAFSAICSIKEKIDIFNANSNTNNDIKGILNNFNNINELMYNLYLEEYEKMLRGINLLLYYFNYFNF